MYILYIALGSCALAATFIAGTFFASWVRTHKYETKTQEVNLQISWQDFIEVNICRAVTAHHCLSVIKMLELYQVRFKGEVGEGMAGIMERLYNMLDTRYKNILKEDALLSEMTFNNKTKKLEL